VAGPLIDISGLLNPSWAWAAGGIVSNGDKITTFYRRLLAGGLLRSDLLAQMKSVVPHYDYGLGLSRFQTACGRAFGHVGDYPGYRTVAIARPNGTRVAVTMVSIDTTRVPWDELEAVAVEAYCSG
jgi:D-alanyl-D-alanine carboxypeptidase